MFGVRVQHPVKARMATATSGNRKATIRPADIAARTGGTDTDGVDGEPLKGLFEVMNPRPSHRP